MIICPELNHELGKKSKLFNRENTLYKKRSQSTGKEGRDSIALHRSRSNKDKTSILNMPANNKKQPKMTKSEQKTEKYNRIINNLIAYEVNTEKMLIDK